MAGTAPAPRFSILGVKQDQWADFCMCACRSREWKSHEGHLWALLPLLTCSLERCREDAAAPWLCMSCCPPSLEAASKEEDSWGAVVPLFISTQGGHPEMPSEHFSCNFTDAIEARCSEDRTLQCSENQAFLPWSKSSIKNRQAPAISLAFSLIVRTPLFPSWQKEYPQELGRLWKLLSVALQRHRVIQSYIFSLLISFRNFRGWSLITWS